MQAASRSDHRNLAGPNQPSIPPAQSEGLDTPRSSPTDHESRVTGKLVDDFTELVTAEPYEHPYINAFRQVPLTRDGRKVVLYASQACLHLLIKHPVDGKYRRYTLPGIITNKNSPHKPDPKGDNILNFVVYEGVIVLLTKNSKLFIARQTGFAEGHPVYKTEECNQKLTCKVLSGYSREKDAYSNNEDALDGEINAQTPLANGEKFTTGKGVWLVGRRLFFLTLHGISYLMLDELVQNHTFTVKDIAIDPQDDVEDFFANDTKIAFLTYKGQIGQIEPDLTLKSLDTLDAPAEYDWKWNCLCDLPKCDLEVGYDFHGGILVCGSSGHYKAFGILDGSLFKNEESWFVGKTEGSSHPIQYMRAQATRKCLFVVAAEAKLNIHLFGIIYQNPGVRAVANLLLLHTIVRPMNSDQFRPDTPSENINCMEKIGDHFMVGGGTWKMMLRIS